MPSIDVSDDARTAGHALRQRRKTLRISMAAAAEAAGMSRVTWYRLEKGTATVALGALLAATRVLGLRVALDDAAASAEEAPAPAGYLPLRIRVARYPQLLRLAWQLDTEQAVLTPREAFGLYQRNWRHVDVGALDAAEHELIDALRLTLGGDWPGV